MQLSVLQSLISRTRNEINSLHEEALAAKDHRNHMYELAGNITGCYEADWQQRGYLRGLANNAHSDYEKTTKTLAKLALIQKALKKEMLHTLLDEAFLKTLAAEGYKPTCLSYLDGAMNYE